MNSVIKEEEVVQIVNTIFADYNGEKTIDEVSIYNKPDMLEVHDLIKDLFAIVYPGYFRDKYYKTFNPKSNLAVIIEDVFYHLNKQVYMALEYCRKRGTLTDDERKQESYRICKTFFGKIRN